MKMVSEYGKTNAKKAFQAGVKIGLGTDAAVYPHGFNAHELDVYVRDLGMTPLQAIQTATINDADLLGLTDKIGTLEPGKSADIIAIDGNPLQDVTTLQEHEVRDEGRRGVQEPEVSLEPTILARIYTDPRKTRCVLTPMSSVFICENPWLNLWWV